MFAVDELSYTAGSLRRRFDILQGVTIRPTGGVIGLLGPNGAGKTTLLRLCATVLAMQDGAVTLADRVLSPASTGHELREARRQVGYLPQHFPVLPRYTVTEYLRYLGWLGDQSGRELDERCARALEAVNLTSRAESKVGALSGGMRRRLGIAQCLVTDPAVILLDEPTTGLDPEERRRFRRLVADLAEDRTVVLSTHLVEDVVRVADAVVVMDDGRVRFQGTVAELAGAQDPSVEQVEDGYAAAVEAA